MSSDDKKYILVLARENYPEAMRVAAGLTIFGHEVELVFTNGIIDETADTLEQAELLELCEIEPSSLMDDPNVPRIEADRLSMLINRSDHVVSI